MMFGMPMILGVGEINVRSDSRVGYLRTASTGNYGEVIPVTEGV